MHGSIHCSFQQRFLPGARFSRLIAAVAVLGVLLSGVPINALGQEVPELKINSKRYIVIDAETGEVYAQRGADDQVAMASITKIFTAIEAIETSPLDRVLTTRESDLLDPAVNSLFGFKAGENLTLEELLMGLMLPSGNDAALTIARELAYQPGDTPKQSVDRFVDRMNQRVADMGLENTQLVNPHGWGVPGHYSSARDIAAFTRYALDNPTFVRLISTYEYTTASGNKIYNNNRLMQFYPELLGGKTGYDWDAGWCLMEVAKRGDKTMISVTLDGIHENMDWYDDNEVLLKYGFDQKAERLTTGEIWSGDTAVFRNPDPVFLQRSTSASGSVAGQADPTLIAELAQLAEVQGDALNLQADSLDNATRADDDPVAALNGEADPDVSRDAGAAAPTRGGGGLGGAGETLIAIAAGGLLLLLGFAGVVVSRPGRTRLSHRN